MARFNPSKPIEKFVRYWSGMSSVSISLPGGIVDLKVRAFTAEDATKIASAVLEISEALINDMNERINQDAVSNAEFELDRTSARLAKAQVALETARNDTGLLDVVKTSEALNKLITDTRSALLLLQQQYISELKYVSEFGAADAHLESADRRHVRSDCRARIEIDGHQTDLIQQADAGQVDDEILRARSRTRSRRTALRRRRRIARNRALGR